MEFRDSGTKLLTTLINLSVIFVVLTPPVCSHAWDFHLHSRGQDIGHVTVHLADEHNIQKRSPISHDSSRHHSDSNENSILGRHDNHDINNEQYKHDERTYNNNIMENQQDFYKRYNHQGGYKENNVDDWSMPSTLTFTFYLQNDDVTLKLKKNELLSRSSPPIYLVHDGLLVKRGGEGNKKHKMGKGNPDEPMWGLYTDPDKGASVMVSTRPSPYKGYHMTGTYFQDGQEYSIRPIMGNTDGTADHVISRLFQEANLLHDVIDLDQESSFVASMTSINDFMDSDDALGSNDVIEDDEEADTSDATGRENTLHNSVNTATTKTTITTKEVYEQTTQDDYHRLETAPTTPTATTVLDNDNRSNKIINSNKKNSSTYNDVGTQNNSGIQITSNLEDKKINPNNTNTRKSSSAISGRIAQILNDIEKNPEIHKTLQDILNIFSMKRNDGILDLIENLNDSDIFDSIVNKDEILDRYFDLEEDSGDDKEDDTWTLQEDKHQDERTTWNEEEDAMNGESRKRRQAVKKYELELLIVIDYGVYEIWYNGVTDKEGAERQEEAIRRIKQFYSFVINGVDLRYKSVQAHADYTIDVSWAGIIIFDTPDPTYWADTPKPPTSPRDFVESSSALEAFRAWAERQGQALPPSDHVMLFTGHNLTYGGSVSNAGLAYLGSACNPDYFFSIVEEYFEFRDVAIAAHELGHSLGARHDMDGNTCLSFNRFIMTPRFKFPSRRKAQNPWLFSPCSVSYFTDFIQGLDKNDTNCFVTKDAEVDDTEIQPFLVSLPGEVYSGDDFCRIGSGPSSYICRSEHIQDYDTTCYRGLLCYEPTEGKCVSKLPPNGMPCGSKKWCMNGTCTPSNLAPVASGDDCPFGDDPGLIGGKTCSERMLTTRYDCYRDTFRAKCCASCRKYRRNLPGCEYGDRFELCKRDQCVNYDEEYAKDNCCDTCADLLFTIPTTITTTAAPTTPAPTTTPKIGVVTVDKTGGGESKGEGQTGNGSGGGSGNGEGGVFPPEGSKTKKGERKSRRRNYVDSDESGDSDEKRPRYRERGAERQPWYRNGKAYGRMVEIQNLLQRMREARDDDRLQRLKLLIYLLDRTAGSRLASVLLGGNDSDDNDDNDDNSDADSGDVGGGGGAEVKED